MSYVKVLQIRTNIRPHEPIIDLVAAVLGVPAHGARAVALVVVVRALFCCEGEPAEGFEEGGGGVHIVLVHLYIVVMTRMESMARWEASLRRFGGEGSRRLIDKRVDISTSIFFRLHDL